MSKFDRPQPLEVELRRLVPRQFTDWPGRYKLDGDRPRRWRECRVTDVSVAGAGLALSDARVHLEKDTMLTLAVELRGVVRHVREDGWGLRAGVAFVDLSELEREYLRSMRRSGTRW